MKIHSCYALQDKTWVRDPDGNEWEAFVVLEDNLTETAPCECGNKVTDTTVDNEAAATMIAPATCCAPTPVEVTHDLPSSSTST